jgi:hypothetical protein
MSGCALTGPEQSAAGKASLERLAHYLQWKDTKLALFNLPNYRVKPASSWGHFRNAELRRPFRFNFCRTEFGIPELFRLTCI